MQINTIPLHIRMRWFPLFMIKWTTPKLHLLCTLINKQIDPYMRLPIAVTRMIAHGHGDYRYAQFGIDIYPHDSNHTVGSIAKLLQDLENPPKYSSWELFEGARSWPLFDVILKGSKIWESSLLLEPPQ